MEVVHAHSQGGEGWGAGREGGKGVGRGGTGGDWREERAKNRGGVGARHEVKCRDQREAARVECRGVVDRLM